MDMANTGVEAGAAVGKTGQEVIVPLDINQLRTIIQITRHLITTIQVTYQLRTTPIINMARHLQTNHIIILLLHLHSKLNRDVETVLDAAVYSTRSYNALVIALVVASKEMKLIIEEKMEI